MTEGGLFSSEEAAAERDEAIGRLGPATGCGTRDHREDPE